MVRVLIAAAAVVAFGLMSAPPTVAATAAVAGNAHRVAPRASVDRVDASLHDLECGQQLLLPELHRSPQRR
jgi:hypothetical protein